MMAVLSSFAIVAIIPALALLYREYIGRPGSRASIELTVSVAAVSAGVWLLATGFIPGVGLTALWLPTAALAALAGFLCTLPVRDRTGSVRAAVGWCLAWTTLVFVPVALAVLYPSVVGVAPGDRALDLGGAIPVHIAVGSSAVAWVIMARKGDKPEQRRVRPVTWAMVVLGLLLWAGWTCGLVGLELAFDEVTAKIVLNSVLAPVASTIAWIVIQRIRSHTTSLQGAVSGLVCGLVAVTPTAGFLQPTWAIVIGVAAGAFGCLLTIARLRSPYRRSWYLFSTHFLPAAIGLLLAGIFASGPGFIFTGQVGVLSAQVATVVAVSGWSILVSAVLSQFVLVFLRRRHRLHRP